MIIWNSRLRPISIPSLMIKQITQLYSPQPREDTEHNSSQHFHPCHTGPPARPPDHRLHPRHIPSNRSASRTDYHSRCKSQQPPGLGIFIVVRLTAIDKLLGILVPTGTVEQKSVSHRPQSTGRYGIFVGKVVRLVFQTGPAGVGDGHPVLSGGGEVVLVEQTLDGWHGLLGGWSSCVGCR